MYRSRCLPRSMSMKVFGRCLSRKMVSTASLKPRETCRIDIQSSTFSVRRLSRTRIQISVGSASVDIVWVIVGEVWCFRWGVPNAKGFFDTEPPPSRFCTTATSCVNLILWISFGLNFLNNFDCNWLLFELLLTIRDLTLIKTTFVIIVRGSASPSHLSWYVPAAVRKRDTTSL